MSAKPPTTHPLVASYLDELSHLLSGIDPAERAEVIEGVREHINSSLEGTAATERDQRTALAEVGPAQSVADEAYAGWPHAAPTGSRAPITSRSWLPVVTAALEAVAVLLVVGAAAGAGGVTSSSSSTEVSVDGTFAATPTTTIVTESHFDGAWAGALGGLFVALPFWLILAVLVGMSALWVGREKVVLIAVVPASALAFAVLPEVGYLIFGINGVYVGAWLALALSVLAGGALVGALTRRGYRRANAT